MAGALLSRQARVASTQDLIHALGDAGAPTGSAIVAEEQVGGRGSRGRTWASPPGGLWMSVLCRPASEVAAAVLSLRVGLAAAEVLEAQAPGATLALKWPNDLMLADRKLGGILCEARWQGGLLAWVAVGLGLNVANPLPAEVRDRAVALASVAPGLTPDVLAEPLRAAITQAGAATGPLTPDEVARYVARDWLRGRVLAEPVAGTGAGLAPDGALLVQGAGGVITAVRAGTVLVA
ncbi:MAG: biotin--[acetyl-CoA-carboxylase] ligase [Gemmatimonadetes bacterium]|nr:biotin--[acetyl-CoA-carboxylase] ligase [Gemmatimonadota bacterium]